MKKLLLSLFAVLTAATSAFAVTDVLKITDFKKSDGTAIDLSSSGYNTITYTSETTGVTYTGSCAVNLSKNFQIKKNTNGIWVSANTDRRTISKVTVTIASGTGPYTVYAGTSDLDGSNTTSLTNIDEANSTNTFEFSPVENYTAFLISAGKNAIYISEIEVEYEDAKDPRTYVTLSYPEKSYDAFLDSDFESPTLTCDPEEGLAQVKFTSSDETVATVDAFGKVTILDDGATTISAYIPDDDTKYYSNTASYDLIVKDPNAITVELTADFFGTTTTYQAYTKEDPTTKVKYNSVQYKTNGMQFNTKSNAGCGISVITTSPNFIIASVNIEFYSTGNGLDIYKQNTAYAANDAKTAIDTSNSTKIASAVKENGVIAIGAPAFAIVPSTTGVIQITKVTVTYAKRAADDGSVYFECEAFQDYMVCKDDAIEITLPEDAPEVKFEVANSEIASIENGTITGHKPGNTKVTASWDAVPGKWMAGVEEFTIFVKYSNLAEVLADAEDPTTGFVNEGQRYIGNFPITIAADLDGYNYVTDGTAWALFYFDKKTAADHNHGEGSVIDAGWSAIYSVYNDLPEFTGMQHSEITDTKGEFTINSYDDLTVDEKVINEVLILKDVTFTTATPDASNNLYNGAYSGQDLTFMNRFEIESVEAGSYDVKAAVGIYQGEIQVWPIAYTALEATTAAVHVDAELKIGEEIKFTGLEEGAHVYYRHGGENPDHTNVFVEETTPADAPRKAATADVNTEWTYNHTTHPLTYQGEPMQVKYYAKAPGKAPSAVNELNVDENGSTTGIESIAVDAANGEVEYFNLQGQRVANPAAGLYIMRQGNEVRKVLVK
ncbi:MAG: hypothetical protein HDR90_07015 [Bacteroides sp.]|nr:hypothetical protein [Bacteroides sp.]